jgi:transposase
VGYEPNVRLLKQDAQTIRSALYEARLELALLMAANVAALLRLLRTLGARGAAATAKAAAQERHRAVLRLIRVWTQDVINTLCPTFGQL